MRKILKQLKEMYPNTHIIVQSYNGVYSNGRPANEYRVYIDNDGIWKNNWSPAFRTSRDLDSYLADYLYSYERVYK